MRMAIRRMVSVKSLKFGVEFEARCIDNGEFVHGYYMSRPNLPGGYKHYIVTVGSCKWMEIEPSTLAHYHR